MANTNEKRKGVQQVLDRLIANASGALTAEDVLDLMRVRAITVDVADKLDILVRFADEELQDTVNFGEVEDSAKRERTVEARQSYLRFFDLTQANPLEVKLSPQDPADEPESPAP